MKPQHILPTILIIIDVSAAIVHAYHGDLRKFVYWIAAAILTASVTF
jgi:hypothetical protein